MSVNKAALLTVVENQSNCVIFLKINLNWLDGDYANILPILTLNSDFLKTELSKIKKYFVDNFQSILASLVSSQNETILLIFKHCDELLSTAALRDLLQDKLVFIPAHAQQVILRMQQ